MTTKRICALALAIALGSSAPTAQAAEGWGSKLGEFLTELPLADAWHWFTSINSVAWVNENDLKAANVYYVVDANSRVLVRAGASTDTAIIDKLNPGDAVQIIGKNPFQSWYHVQLSDNREGYIHQDLLRVQF
ncbi:SH3 domain-containing protein [Pseudidiomarina sp.]|uniref:SH3 domain-containing protein n=1 Tax=Pseudidiomarina sp. TaxID=2081707 RepID=UPI003A9833AA